MKLSTYFWLLIFVISSVHISGQDSIYSIYLNNNLHDSTRYNAINDMVWNQMFSNPDSAIALAKEQRSFAISIKNLKQEAKALNNEGIANSIQGNADSAEACYLEAIKISTNIKDYKKVASIYNNLGILYKEKNSLPKSLDYFYKALTTHEKNNDKPHIASTLNNIGTIFYMQGDYEKAENHFQKSLTIATEIDDQNNLANALQNIAIIRIAQKEFEEAITINRKVATIRVKLNQTQGIAEVYGNLGSCFLGLIPEEEIDKSDISSPNLPYLDSAFQYYSHGLNLARSIDARYEIADNLKGLGQIAFLRQDYSNAVDFYIESSQISEEYQFLNLGMLSYEGLYNCYKEQNKSDLALVNLEKQIVLKDSIEKVEDQKNLIQKELQFEFDKQTLATKKEQEKKDAIAKITLYSVIAGLGLVVLFSLFIFNRFRVISKQKKLIEIQKKETEKQHRITEVQKQKIEIINHELTDSINYAEKIQSALLQSTDSVKKAASDYFNIYKPKDIVSGDFYWGAEKENYVYIACVDCTGHGVPGAFMSMLGMAFLNEIIATPDVYNTDEILDLLRAKIIKELHQTGAEGENKDGMDISLCRIDKTTSEKMSLQFSGANNSVFILPHNSTVDNSHLGDNSWTHNNQFIAELKGDKQPIGFHLKMANFSKKEVILQKGDSIYMTSDGFPDQFGGPKNKKFMMKNLRTMLCDIQHLTFEDQKAAIEETLISHMGDFAQIDDICMIGVKL